MIILYGARASSSGKTHWLLEELGEPYEYRPVDRQDPAAMAEFRKVCPSGRVPFLIDGDLRLLESMAINLHLADRYGKDLTPASPAERAHTLEWSFWAISNLQPEALAFMGQAMLPEAERNPHIADRARDACVELLGELEAVLTEPYLLGQRFTVADVNVGSVVNLALRSGVPGPLRVQAWMEGLRARPAYQRAAKGG